MFKLEYMVDHEKLWDEKSFIANCDQKQNQFDSKMYIYALCNVCGNTGYSKLEGKWGDNLEHIVIAKFVLLKKSITCL